jgi:prepilin-type N-terminal cleavage/methylation domain-containing protein
MTNRKGFTLIELMVVIFIVGILAAVAIPIMRGRIDAAKWSEGKAAAGSIRTAMRAWIAEKGNDFDYQTAYTGLTDLGFAAGDLDGKYFLEADYTVAITNGGGAVQPTYIITVGPSTAAEGPTSPASVTLDDTGLFSDQ